MNEIDKLENQRYIDDHLFVEWWVNLIKITQKLEEDFFLDVFLIRSFFVHLYELFVTGKEYSNYAKTWNTSDQKYQLFEKLHNNLSAKISDDDFFMINYYRHSACHIFVSHYSWLKSYNSAQVKPITKKLKFKKKDGTVYYLSQEEIRDTAKRLIGTFGTGEDVYKRNLFKRLSPIISPQQNNTND